MYISDDIQLSLSTDMQLINSLDEAYTEYVDRVGDDMWPARSSSTATRITASFPSI